MAFRNINERPVPGGSNAARLSPKLVNTELNARLGPRFPVTSEPGKDRRRSDIALSERLKNKG